MNVYVDAHPGCIVVFEGDRYQMRYFVIEFAKASASAEQLLAWPVLFSLSTFGLG